MKNKVLILALYKLLSAKSDEKLIAWDFPPSTFKKAYFELKSYLKGKGIPITQPDSNGEFADWPHFSIALIPLDTKAEVIEKIKLAAPVYATQIKTDRVKIFEGTKAPKTFIVWGLKPQSIKEITKFREFIFELTGDSKEYLPFSPHASLAVCDRKHTEQLKELLPEIEKILKRYSTTYTPSQIQIWKDFKIDDIESLEFK